MGEPSFLLASANSRYRNIAVRLGTGEASTEELRTAMIHYRSLFDELVRVQTPADKRVA